ncbi:hypothetical protein AB0L25_09880 [Spirillospora sp. NPDC052242]
MGSKPTVGASARWDGPTYDESGKFWSASVRYRLTDRERAVGIEPVV